MTTYPKRQAKYSLSDSKIWLFISAINLALFYGIISNRMDSQDLLINAFFWILALFILWKKRDDIIVSPQTTASVVGFLILGWLLFRSLSTFWFDNIFLQALPVVGFFSLALIASGWKKLNLYVKPLFALFLLGLADNLLARIFRSQLNFSELTAQASAFFLHYIGFDVTREEVFIHLNEGSVEVWYPCTGGPLITLLLQLTFALILVVPLSWRLLSNLVFGIFGLGFFLGVVRVALLAVVVSDEATFDYWHGSQGNQIFSLIAFSIWIVGAHFVYENHENNFQNQSSSSSEQDQKLRKEDEDYHLPRQISVTTISPTSPRSWLLPLAGVMMASATVITLLIPQIGRREIPPLQFPQEVSLSGWKQANSFPLVTNPETGLVSHRPRSGQEYHYQKQQTTVNVALRFVSPTDGRVKAFIEQAYSESLKQAYQQGNTGYLPNLGYYRLFQDEEKAYLSACLTPIFESTVDKVQYSNLSNKHFFDPKTLIPRLLGQKSFRERRCLWINLSTPLNSNSPEASYQILESVFKAGYPKWQGLFEN